MNITIVIVVSRSYYCSMIHEFQFSNGQVDRDSNLPTGALLFWRASLMHPWLDTLLLTELFKIMSTHMV